MTPADEIAEALSAWQPAGTGRHSWTHTLPAAGWEVRLSADRADSVGCVAWELSLTRNGTAPEGLTTRTWAERTASRASGLLEPLQVIEVDDAQGEAVLRSGPPSKKGAVASYYEVTLAGTGKAAVRRYQADTKAGTPRVQAGFALTHEVMGRLVESLARD